MLFHLKLILHILVLPPACLLLVALAGVLVGRRRPALGRGLVTLSLVLLWLLSTPLVARQFERWSEDGAPLDLHAPVDAGAVAILGGGVSSYAAEYGGPAPIGDALERVVYGAHVARALHLPILVTGTALEAEGMRTMLERDFSLGVRWIDGEARDTYENARHSARLLGADGVRSVVLVTSADHMRRARHEFEAAGLKVIAAPTGAIAPPAGPGSGGLYSLLPTEAAFGRSETALRELIGDLARPVMQALHGLAG